MNKLIENNKRILELIPKESILSKLEHNKPLIIKSGIDPTSTDIHFGHFLGLMLLKDFINQGHIVEFVIGDFTAQLGDGVERPQLSLQQTKDNSEKLVSFLTNFFQSDNFHIRKQSDWFEHTHFEDILKHFSKISLSKLLSHETTIQKISSKSTINIQEFIYPIIMAIDSIVIKPDIEIGSIEQKFNLEICRELMSKEGLNPEDIIINKRLMGIDGSEKMSKSQNNFIGIFENLDVQIEKVLKIPNSLIFEFLDLLSDLQEEQLTELRMSNDWFEAKKLFVFNVLSLFHNKSDISREWNRLEKSGLKSIKQIELLFEELSSLVINDILVSKGLIISNRELKRNVDSGKIKLNNQVLNQKTIKQNVSKGDRIDIGKRTLLTII